MRLFYIIRNWVLGSRQIAVGHCNTPKGSGVLLIMGHKRAGLTPAGARNIADQLRVWADHAETDGRALTTMRWIIKVSERDLGVDAVKEWFASSLEETADSLKTAAGNASRDRRPDAG